MKLVIRLASLPPRLCRTLSGVEKCTEAGDPHNVEKIVFVSLTVMMVDRSTTPFTEKSVEDLVDIYL